MVIVGVSRKRQRTRARLIEATLALVSAKGFAAASLDDIAARAGVTKGAIYSNYRSKGELLWDAARGRQLVLAPQLVPGASDRELAEEIARGVMALVPQAAREAEFHRELAAYVRSDRDLQVRQAAEQTALFDDWSVQIENGFGHRLRISARQLVVASQALTRGFLTQAALTPGEVTQDVVAAAFEALITGALR